MNLRDLEYLVAVADHLHFGKAATACHVSQPTLSMQIRKLEEYLSIQFFERSNKRVMVTPMGERIVREARQILRHASDIREIAKNAQNPLAGEFRLGVFPTLAPYLLPRCIPPLHAKLPQLKLLLVEEKTDKLIALLCEGKLDAALLALPVENERLQSAALFDDPFMLAVPKTHPLATRKQVTIHDLIREPILLLEEGHCMRAQALEICSVVRAKEYQEFRATSLETLRHMVSAGGGVTLIPKIAMNKDDGLRYIPFRDKKVARTIGMVWRKQASREKAIAAIMEIIHRSEKNQ